MPKINKKDAIEEKKMEIAIVIVCDSNLIFRVGLALPVTLASSASSSFFLHSNNKINISVCNRAPVNVYKLKYK